jgi:hypothetical protein
MSRDIVHAVEIRADPTILFDAIATEPGQTAFWTTDAHVEPRLAASPPSASPIKPSG